MNKKPKNGIELHKFVATGGNPKNYPKPKVK